jgi:hypothetical protein
MLRARLKTRRMGAEIVVTTSMRGMFRKLYRTPRFLEMKSNRCITTIRVNKYTVSAPNMANNISHTFRLLGDPSGNKVRPCTITAMAATQGIDSARNIMTK